MATRPEIVGQGHGAAQDVLKNGLGNLSSCSGDVAAVRGLCIMPKATAPGAPEKLGQFDVHALVLPARNKGQDKHDQLGESKFAVTGEIGV